MCARVPVTFQLRFKWRLEEIPRRTQLWIAGFCGRGLIELKTFTCSVGEMRRLRRTIVKYGAGRKLLRGIGKYEDKCEKWTEKHIPRWGKKAPACYEYLGQLLAYADMIGSCAYGCPGGGADEHAVWYLVSRSSSFGRAALRLMKMGFYDEALTIVRSIGEISNLLLLFGVEPSSIKEWEQSDRAYRLDKLSPGKIRKRIQNLGGQPPMSADKYSALCEISTHPVPEARPQGFNHARRAMTGGMVVQETGALVVLNELTMTMIVVVFMAARVCKVPKETVKEIREVCEEAIKHLGSIDVTNFADTLKSLKGQPKNP